MRADARESLLSRLDDSPSLAALTQAQRLAFAPMYFQAVRCLRAFGVLALLRQNGGATLEQLEARLDLSRYALTVLLEAGLSAEVVEEHEGTWQLTHVGQLIETDELTRRNVDFVHDICYRAMFHLDEALREGTPAGLKELSDLPTIYEALATLPPQVRESWFRFDHFYSDVAFPHALRYVLARNPRRLLDVGGNTGRFARFLARRAPEIRVTIADLPGQLATCREELEGEGLVDRIHLHPVNVLKAPETLPRGFDAIWMSQFLCCFAEDEVVRILDAARPCLAPKGRLFVLDTFWDEQRYPAGVLSLHATSLYFTCIANGNSRMYDGRTMERFVREAGLEIGAKHRDIGLSHSLLELVPTGSAK